MKLTEAASVVLARAAGSPELFLVRRASDLRFFPGYQVFPGGKVDAADGEVPVQGAAGAAPDPRRAAAVRELFEETGVLLARRADGSFPVPRSQWNDARRRLDAGQMALGELLSVEELTIHAADLPLIGRLITPPFSALRFDTTFFLATLPAGQSAEVWPGELVDGLWGTADDFWRDWHRGVAHVAPPALSMLSVLRGRAVDSLPSGFAPVVAALERGALPVITFAPGVQMLPLRTIGLPPASYTNAYLVGTGPTYLIDPGCDEPDEQQRLFDALDPLQDAGPPLTGVVLTHHHPDHVGAAMACARRYGVPIVAHRATAAALAGRVEVTIFLDEGDRLELGPAPDGSGPWHLETLHTPGHAAGHLAFYEPHYQLLFAGDLVSMLSSVVIAPPDGDLAVYLTSLQRIRGLSCRMLLPAHGSASTRVRHELDECLAHRRRREQQLCEALAGGRLRATPDLVAQMYPGLAEPLLRLAELQVLAGLLKLEREGRAERIHEGEASRWRLGPPAADATPHP